MLSLPERIRYTYQFKAYHDGRRPWPYRISFLYPRRWRKMTGGFLFLGELKSQMLAMFMACPGDHFHSPIIQLSFEARPEAPDLDAWLQHWQTKIQSEQNQGQIQILSTTRLEKGGIAAATMETQWPQTYKRWLLVCAPYSVELSEGSIGSIVFWLKCSCDLAERDIYVPLFEQIIDSFCIVHVS